MYLEAVIYNFKFVFDTWMSKHVLDKNQLKIQKMYFPQDGFTNPFYLKYVYCVTKIMFFVFLVMVSLVLKICTQFL